MYKGIGWSDTLYKDMEDDLDIEIIKFTLPKLKVFKQNMSGYPGNLNSIEEWEEILDKIIYSFEEHLKDVDGKEIDEGFMLFGKYLRDLWI